jgi:hypothetical protein
MATAQAQGLRAEVGKPLQQASPTTCKPGKASEALAKVARGRCRGRQDRRRAADHRPHEGRRRPARGRHGHRDRGAGGHRAQGRRRRAAGQVAEQLAAAYAQQRNNAKATEWMNKAIAAGNNSATIKQLQAYLQGASGDYAAIAKRRRRRRGAAEQAGRRPDEGDLLRLADAQQRTGNNAGYSATLEKLLPTTPRRTTGTPTWRACRASPASATASRSTSCGCAWPAAR